MRPQFTFCVLAGILLTGCNQLEGTYYPGCVAFEGDKIVLREGEVVWDRFTDQVIIDVDGNPKDPFPDFPKTGTYQVEGDLLHLTFADSDVARTLHIRRVDERVLLLDAENIAEWERSGRYNECVLTLARDEVPQGHFSSN